MLIRMILFFLTLTSSVLLRADDGLNDKEQVFEFRGLEFPLVEAFPGAKEKRDVGLAPKLVIDRSVLEKLKENYRLDELNFDADTVYSYQSLLNVQMMDSRFKFNGASQQLMSKMFIWANYLLPDLKNNEISDSEVIFHFERLKQLLPSEVLKQVFLQAFLSKIGDYINEPDFIERLINIAMQLGLDLNQNLLSYDFRCNLLRPLSDIQKSCRNEERDFGGFDEKEYAKKFGAIFRLIEKLGSEGFGDLKCYWDDSIGHDINAEKPERLDLYSRSGRNFMPSFNHKKELRNNPLYEISYENRIEALLGSSGINPEFSDKRCRDIDIHTLMSSLKSEVLNETTKLTNSIGPESKFQTYRSDFGFGINKGNRRNDFLDLEVIPSYHSSCSNAKIEDEFVCLLVDAHESLDRTYPAGFLKEGHIDRLGVCSESDRVTYMIRGRFRGLSLDNLRKWFSPKRVDACLDKY